MNNETRNVLKEFISAGKNLSISCEKVDSALKELNENEFLKRENEILRGILNVPKVDCDGTNAPWWAIIMPRQIMSKDPQEIANCIVGVFFSRESAQNHLDSRRYEYGSNAVVYCFSGYWSHEYKEAVKNAKKHHNLISDLNKSRKMAKKLDDIFDPIAEKELLKAFCTEIEVAV